jgi:hypothetical protein
MTVDVTTFRADFPEFSDTTKYPVSGVQYYLSLAVALFNTDRWGLPAPAGQPNGIYEMGVELFIAHNLALERRAQNEAASGGVPGLSSGIVSSKGVGGVSISFATGLGIDPSAGQWNLTVYGQRLWNLIEMMGMGPITVVDAGCSAGSPFVGPISFMGVTWDG